MKRKEVLQMRVGRRSTSFLCAVLLTALILNMLPVAFAYVPTPGGNKPELRYNYLCAATISGESVSSFTDLGVIVEDNDFVPPGTPDIRLEFWVNVTGSATWANNKSCIKLKDVTADEYVNLGYAKKSGTDDTSKRSIFIKPQTNLVTGHSYKIEIDGGLQANNGVTLGTPGVVTKELPFSANTGGVSCTVATRIISVFVDTESVNYGTVGLGQESSPSSEIVAYNNGNVTEDLSIKGADATITGGTPWALSDTAIGTDQYMHNFGKSDDSYATFTPLSTDYQALKTGLEIYSGSSTGQQRFKVKIKLPSETTTQGTFSTTVTVQATDPT
jgi:hypothetical protein